MATYFRLSRQFTYITKSQFQQSQRHFSKTTYKMAANLNSENISKITDAEKKLTGMDFTSMTNFLYHHSVPPTNGLSASKL